jgi:hypothetical protein
LPRYQTEPEALRRGPVWFYDQAFQQSIPFDANRDKELMERVADAIHRRFGMVDQRSGETAASDE